MLRLLVMVTLLVGACDADELPAGDAGFACGVNDHECCPDDAAVRCEPGTHCEDERGRGHWVCNPDTTLPDGGE